MNQCLDLGPEVIEELVVEHLDILADDVAPHHYKVEAYICSDFKQLLY